MRYRFCTVVCVLLALCLLPACAQEPPAAAADMRPTDCALTGLFDAFLYVPLEGGVYRYEKVDRPIETASKGKRVFSFAEDTGFAQYGWQVYTVKEYPDLSHVWAESGADYAASVRVAHYHTLDPARCDPAYYAAYREDYPALCIHELSYDGMVYSLRWEENGK